MPDPDRRSISISRLARFLDRRLNDYLVLGMPLHDDKGNPVMKPVLKSDGTPKAKRGEPVMEQVFVPANAAILNQARLRIKDCGFKSNHIGEVKKMAMKIAAEGHPWRFDPDADADADAAAEA
jgi:hypothetical protein